MNALEEVLARFTARVILRMLAERADQQAESKD